MNTLVVRPKPIDDEYILGYIIRVMRLNYIHDNYQFLSNFTNAKSLRKTLSNIATKDFRIELFSLYVSKSSQLISNLYVEDYLQKYTSTIPKICSFCYAKEGFINKKWLLPVNVICERHLVFLTNKCNKCGRVLEWHFLQFYICRTCKQSINSTPIPQSLCSTSPYLQYILNKKQQFIFSDQQIIDVMGFFLMLTKGYSLYTNQIFFYRVHEFSQEKILESYDDSLNYFLKYNLFENFLIETYENTPYDIDRRNRFYDCFQNIDQYINDKNIRSKLLESIKKVYFVKNRISNSAFHKIKSIISLNISYHAGQIIDENLKREMFDLVTLFQFKYITKTQTSTLIFLIANSFIDVLKCKNGRYKYISIYSIYKITSMLKAASSSLLYDDEKYIKKFIDLNKEQKKDFLYSIMNGHPYKYEYDILIGIDGIKILMP